MSPRANHRATFLAINRFPDLDRGESEATADLARASLDDEGIADARRRHERGVNVRGEARVGLSRRLDGQPSGPVRQADRHGPVQRALGVEVHGRDLQQGRDVPRRRVHDGDVVEQDLVDRAVRLHLRPVVAHLRQYRGWG